MDRTSVTRARPPASRLPVPASRAAPAAEGSRKEELVSNLRSRINTLEAEKKELQSENDKLKKTCKELKERGAALSSSRKQLLEQLNAYKTQYGQPPQTPTGQENSSNAACENCEATATKMAQLQQRCLLLQEQVVYLSRKLEHQVEQQPAVPAGFVHEDYTREVISAMLGQMVERTASRYYKGRVLTLEQEARKAQTAATAAGEQVEALQQTVRVLSSEAAKMTEFDADEQRALKLVLQQKEAALRTTEARAKELEAGQTAAEAALQTARQELETAVTENQHLRVRVELMESAIEAEEVKAETQSQEVQTEAVQPAAPVSDERDARIEELEAKIRALATQLKMANATATQAKENQDTMRRFCMAQFSSAPAMSDL